MNHPRKYIVRQKVFILKEVIGEKEARRQWRFSANPQSPN